MKTKVLFTAALMAAAASGAQAASYTESNMLLQLLESQRYEGVSLLADEVAEGLTDIAGLVLRNAKMPTVIGNWDANLGWRTDTSGGNFQIYAMPKNADVDYGECPEPNAVERWQGNGHHWPENTNIIYQTINVPNGTYTITMWAESQALGDHTHKGGMYLFANEVQAEITNHCVMQQYSLTVEVTNGTLTLGVKTGENGSDDNHVVLSAVSILADNALLEAVSSENPFDATGAVSNATCTEGFGWTKGAGNASASYNVNNGALNSEDYSGGGLEYWTPSGSPAKNIDVIYQDVADLPNGSYRITAVAMGRLQDGTDACKEGLYLFANDGQAEVTTNVWGTVTATGLVTDGTLRIGLRAGENNGNNWVAMSKVKLEYLGEDMNALQDALNAKVEEAHALATTLEGQVPTTYLTQLMEVTAPACSTADEYNAAIAEIDALMAEVNAAHTAFANAFLSATNYAEQVLSAFPGAEESAKSALNSAVETATTAALSSTDDAVWVAQAEAVRAAAKTYFDATDKVMAEGVSNFDVTQLFVVNPGFQDAENPANGWDGLVASNVTESGIAHRGGNDAWRISQTVNVPNGVYSMSLQIGGSRSDRHYFFLRSSNGDQTVMFKWNVDANAVLATWPTDEEAQRNYTGNVLVTDGQITMGVERRYDPDEIYFDNFRLTLVSDGFTEIKALYDALKLQAEAIETEGMPTVFAKALTDALALPVGTAAQYYTAYNALQKAVADCGTVADASVSLPALITECQAYLDNSEGGDEARAALEDALEAAEGYLNLTTAEEIVACEAALETARQEFAKVATPTGDQQFDMTFLLTNACSMGETTGWYGDVVGGNNIGISRSASYIGDLGYSCFVEKWSASVLQPTEDGNGWLIYQQAVLPAGAYTLTAAAFTDMPYNADETVTGHASANLSAGFGSTTIAEGDPIVWTEHEKYPGEVPAEENQNKLKALSIPYFYVAEATTVENPLKLGIYIKADNGADWFGINDMKLYKVAPVAEELALDETQAYAVTADMYANVTMRRTLKAGHWNTFCVPFDMTPEQLAANGISEVRTFSQAAAQGTSVTLQTTVVSDGVKAGIPYIVKVDGEENVTEISVDGVSVTAAEPASHEIAYSDAGYVEWRGNYSAGTVPMGAYFISDDMFYVADTEVALNGFRAYVMLVDEAGAPVQSNVNRMLIDIDGEVTGIEDVLGDGASDANKLVNVYTIGGVLVKSQVKKGEALDGLQKGAYIVDGKTYLK